MRGDGRIQFFRKLETLDKKDIQILFNFRELKTKMLQEKAPYVSGKIYEDK
jgi:hypothetical protein